MAGVTQTELLSIIKPERPTAIVDVGANAIDTHPPYKTMLDHGICTVVGFEPLANALAHLNRRKSTLETYLPHAIADGSKRTLHVCQSPGMTSLLEPDPERLNLFFGFEGLGRVNRKLTIDTKRLDEVDEVDRIDFLKIDAQGSELDILRSGQQKLSHAVAIQTEVSFVPLYKEQPTLGAIDAELRKMGFIPHSMVEMKTWPLKPIISGDYPLKGNWQPMLEADLVYFRDFTVAKNMTGEQWKQVALIAHFCYRSVDLVIRALDMAAQMGAVERNAPQCYVEYLRTQ